MDEKVTLERSFRVKMDLGVHLLQVIHGVGIFGAMPSAIFNSQIILKPLRLQKHLLFSIMD